MAVVWDASDFLARSGIVEGEVEKATELGVRTVAQELLRLSQLEVPLDKGRLMGSGHAQSEGNNEWSVGYYTVYAHRLHEHPEYNFQNGRKGKYLEDPLKRNRALFLEVLSKTIKAAGRAG